MHLKHVFFDLDKTLWDHEVNLHTALRRLFEQYRDEMPGISLENFSGLFIPINESLWQRFSQGKISGPHLRFLRFRLCLQQLGISSNNLARRMSRTFMEIAPRGTALESGAMEVLERLGSRYRLHIITNGLEDSQLTKLRYAGIYPLFSSVTTSDRCGFRKPDPRIFRHAFRRSGATPSEAVFVGDDWGIDVEPALALGFKYTVWYNPKNKERPRPVSDNFMEIRHLSELTSALIPTQMP